jgi:vancomycin resistance protein YoaR
VTLEVDKAKIFSWISYSESASSPKASNKPLSWLALPPEYVYAQGRPNLYAHLSPDLIKNYIGTIAVSVDNASTNAEIRAVDGKITVIKEHVDGEKLLVDEAAALVATTLGQPVQIEKTVITLPVDRIVADIRSDTIEALGIKELIASAETSFRGSPSNRVHNINTGAQFLNGAIVPKGLEFSTVKTLGKVDGSTGYLPELVIKENRTIPEYGGGLCQVSTTLFRAVLQAGLKVTERSNHSYRVSYYEPPVGLDATIYLPKPDFKFLNDTPGYILVQSKVEGTKITFELYGMKDGRVSTVSEPVVTDITDPPEPVYAETDTLPKGETKQIEKAHPGATAVATYTVMREGQEINKQIFRSRYKPWQARFLVGTKEQ